LALENEFVYVFHICNDLVNYAQQNKGEKNNERSEFDGGGFHFLGAPGPRSVHFLVSALTQQKIKK
jgi:hypothetical protein